MNKTVVAVVSGLFGVAMVALIVSKPQAIRDFFGGLGYATGAAVAPATGQFPNYPR